MDPAKLMPQYEALSDEELALVVEGWHAHIDELKRVMHATAKAYKTAEQQWRRIKLVQHQRQGAKKAGPNDAG